MIKIIIATHGELHEGMLNTLGMFTDITDVSSVGLDNQGVALFKERLENLLTTSENCLVLTDIKGGTPYQTALAVKLENDYKIEVLSGLNLAMAIEAVLGRNNMELEQLSKACIATSIESIERCLIEKNENSEDE